MSPHNSQKLFDAFPRLYRGRQLPATESSMLWGFECGDGWFDLIWNLSKAIEDDARSEELTPQSEDWPEATQVKSKLGSLRFHVRKKTAAIWALTQGALEASIRISDVNGLTSQKD